ncbi:camp-dependent protein kinase catalytic subunit [Steccherinum ochraceum]|uniref:Camp-dependent protein kinase catalytic subunit n=1 Tax=Steccherinum ochraceum TaxID=92696 RepID=A0A4R0RPI0_9APHY|nr:camp-dependent protein kinase catalytic subunit [Steccherinum ochraceum]
MATLTALTRMLTLSNEPAQAQKDTLHKPVLPRIRTHFSQTSPPSDDESDTGTPLTPVLVSAYPSPASEGQAHLAPVYSLDIPLQTTANTSLATDSPSDDSDSEPSTPRITVISPQTPLPSPSPASAFCPPWIPDEHDHSGYISPTSSKSRVGEHLDSPLFDTVSPSRRRFRTSAKPKVGPFKFLCALDKGSYGTAFASRDVASGKVICTKVFSKARLAKHHAYMLGLTVELTTYKEIASSDEEQRKWLMSLHAAVQDGQRVLFAMDLMQCDLFALTDRHTPIPRPMVRRWIAQIALGIDALHGMGIIHRDIKPENILLCPDGENVRIADFTNVFLDDVHSEDVEDPTKDLPPKRLLWWKKYAWQCHGTVHYLAPEIFEKKWYGLAVDYWALGCVMFDLIGGETLFPNKETMRHYLRCMRGGISIPEYLDTRASFLTMEEKDLLSGLLCIESDFRFRLEHLETHPYFTMDSDTENTFDFVRSLPTPSSSSPSSKADSPNKIFGKPINPTTLVATQPLCYAKPEACLPMYEGAPEDDEDDPFEKFAWVDPSGLWGTGRD